MTKQTLNVVVDVAAFAEFVLLTASGVLVEYVLPPRTGRFRTIFGLDRHDWGAIHFWIAVVFFATLALHLVLHWKWIVAVVKGRSRESSSGMRVGLAIVGLAALIAFAAIPFMAPVEQTGQSPGRQAVDGVSDEDGSDIRGSMTLREVAASSGMPVEMLVSQLGFPDSVDVDEQLGRLSRTRGVPIQKVRQIVEEFRSRR